MQDYQNGVPNKGINVPTGRCLSNQANGDMNGYTNGYTNGHAELTQTFNHVVEQDKIEPIAIVGLALRFPQDATSPRSFWQMLMEKRSAMTDVPSDRFNIDAFYREGEHETGVLNVKGAHFIKEDIAGFDAPFFSMTPEEAECVDPQQRWLMEIAYEALENAGIPIEQASGTRTSVHIGCFMHDYEIMLSRDPEMHAKYKTTGNGAAMLANRLSWFYNLTGPSISLDTACSSGLNALHLACQSIRDGEATMGLVGGCNLFFNPDFFTSMTDLNFLSPDGKSYSFDHRANGYSRGEGFGMVVVKPLSLALENGDTIRAVIRATGANQDGRTPGITQPSSKAQEDMIRQTYQNGGLDLSETRFFEAHGTGTPLGDFVEASAINAAFEHNKHPLYVGAVKSNIGHLEGASGLAGLIKTVLVLEKAVIPPNTLFERPNEKIPLGDWNIKFPLEATPWPTAGLRRASVSSFGFGGANAHAVLDDAYNYLRLRNLHGKHCSEKAPPTSFQFPTASISSKVAIDEFPVRDANPGPQLRPRLLVWSSSEESGLTRIASSYQKYFAHNVLAPDGECFLDDLAFTLSEKRSHMLWRSFALTSSVSGILSTLENDLSKPTRIANAPRLGFILTGQGAQWPAMGRELLDFPVFNQSLQAADLFLRRLGCTWNMTDEILASKTFSNLSDPTYSQPICTALQIALIELLTSWGIYPATVIGHSSGEIAAAYCVGALSRESAWQIAYYRGVVTASLKEPRREAGAMLAVGLSDIEIKSYLDQSQSFGDLVTVGCINSPRNITLSGCEKRIDAIQMALQKSGIFARKLNVGVAYHTPYMNSVASVYRILIQNIQRGEPLPDNPSMFSSVTGEKISLDELSRSDYWVSNLLSPVRFSQAVSSSFSQVSTKIGEVRLDHRDGISIDYLLEIGPHAALQGPLREIFHAHGVGSSINYSSVLIRGKSASNTALEAAGRLYCKGFPVNLAAINRSIASSYEPSMLTDLPAYPFNHTKKYWLESRLSKNFRFRKFPRHEFLGTPVSDWNPLEARWRNIIRLSENPWIKDHKVNGTEAYPAAGLLVMAIEAARQLADVTKKPVGYRFRDVAIQKALIVSSANGVETQVYLRPSKDANRNFLHWSDFRVCVLESDEWAEVCCGGIAIEYEGDHSDQKEMIEARFQYGRDYGTGSEHCKHSVSHKDIYEHFEKLGFSYGPAFQSLREVRYSHSGEATALVDLRSWETHISESHRPRQTFVIHPAALDAFVQSGFPALTKGGTESFPTLVPTKFRSLWISANVSDPENDIKIYAKARFVGYRNADSEILALTAKGGNPFFMGGFEMTSVTGQDRPSGSKFGSNRLCYYLDWKPDLELLDNQQIASYCSSAVEAEFTELSMKQEEDKMLACYLTFSRVLDRLPREHDFNNKPHLRKYVDWMEYQVNHNSSKDLSIPLSERDGIAKDDITLEQLCSRVANIDAEGRVISTVAQNLIKVLSGEVDGLGLLFSDSSLMEQYYQYAHNNTSAFSKVERYIDAFAHKNSAINVLEIGAGTGGATKRMLGTLMHQSINGGGDPRFTKYVYTDISPSFFEEAKEKFKGAAERMTFATLNIEHDPLGQGFQAAEYDLVVASHVLHATESLEQTLRNTRRLLKPGGKLLIYETVTPDAILPGYIFGLLPGWWLGKEENRKWGPLVTEGEWNAYLTRSGFSGIDLSLGDCEDAPRRGGRVMISTAIDTPVEAAKFPPSPTKTVILTTRGSLLQQTITHRIKAELEKAHSINCVIADIDDPESADFSQSVCVFLPELEQPFLNHISTSRFANLQRIISASQGLLWITTEGEADPTNQMVQGFARCVREETKMLKFVTLSLESSEGIPSITESILQAYRGTMLSNVESYEREFVAKNGMLWINRVIQADHLNGHIYSKTTIQPPEPGRLGQQQHRPLKLSIGTPGMLDTLRFVDDARVRLPLPPNEIEIEVKASGLNFRDVLVALGQAPGDFIGGECAGFVTRAGADTGFGAGDRVVGFFEDSFATLGRGPAITACKIPDDLSFSSAAAIPTVFCTAYYALSHWARMEPGESILIHSAAGGFGQAAVQLAKLYDVEIYATVGSEEKKQFLIDTYQIPEDHIFSSRSRSFAQGIKRMSPRGVDVVINSLAGEALRSSWECVAPYGRFIEVGKKDIYTFGNLPMYPFAKNVAFACVDLDHLVHTNRKLAGRFLKKVMDLYREGKIFVPQPLHTYNASQAEEAFRYMQSGKSKGKIVIELAEDDIVPTVPSMLPTYTFDPNATYLISGGLGGLGRCTARWMAQRNAKNLILLGRQGAKSDVAQKLMDELGSQGVNVAAPPCDVIDRNAVALVLAECSKTMPPIKGCIVGTMVLKDAAFETMSLEDYNIPVRPKVEGTWNLHTLLPKGMDFFILLSSMSGIAGVSGQSNYASGNTYQDALAHRRTAAGEKAVSLNLGVVLSVGYVAEHERVKNMLQGRGFLGVTESDYLALLDYYCNPALPLLSSSECQVVTGLQLPSVLHSQGLPEAFWMQTPMFRHMRQIHSHNSASSNVHTEDAVNLEQLFGSAKSIAEAERILLAALVTKISRSLGVEKDDVDVSKPLFTYGIDSLAAVELRSWFRRDLGADITVFEILGNWSIAMLAKDVTLKSRFVPADLKKKGAE